MIEYAEFIASKQSSEADGGFDPTFLPEAMYPHQRTALIRLVKKGRGAGFIDTGLGKTLIELCFAHNCVLHTNSKALILTPLAVGPQMIKEASRFGVPNVRQSRDGSTAKGITIANYEIIHKFDPADFDCVVLDESSILKNDEGATRQRVTSFLKTIRYRLLATATPSPNDFVELGTSSEALGYLGHVDMLGRYFTNNDNTVDPTKIGNQWRLKGHAERDFFDWVSSWSLSARSPSDLGHDDDRYLLPALTVNDVIVDASAPVTATLFALPPRSLQDLKTEARATVNERCAIAGELSADRPCSVAWCHRNDESAMLTSLIPGAIEVTGAMSTDQKEEALVAFADGHVTHLVTKPKIAGFGLNWQHCAHATYFPSFSYEQYYQAVRRFWRFGQTQLVVIDRVLTPGQSRMSEALDAKREKADALFSKLNSSLNGTQTRTLATAPTVALPKFLKTA